MLFQNIKDLIYCAQCKKIHDYKVHPIASHFETPIKIKSMTTQAIKNYTDSPRWQEKQDRKSTKNSQSKSSQFSPEENAEIKRNYQRLANPFNLKQCSVKVNRIKTKWYKDEVSEDME